MNFYALKTSKDPEHIRKVACRNKHVNSDFFTKNCLYDGKDPAELFIKEFVTEV